MACVLLFRSIGGVMVDVVLREQHTAEMEIAEHPVEKGAKISDHAWRKPYQCTLEGVIEWSAMGGFEALDSVRKAAEPFTLVTGLKVYRNMLIKTLTAERDKEKARVCYFTAECQEVIIVGTSGFGDLGDVFGSLAGVEARGMIQARIADPSTLRIATQAAIASVIGG